MVIGSPRHVRLLWVIDNSPVSFTNSSITDGPIVSFSKDMVEVTFPPKIKNSPTWWETHKQPVVSASTTSQVLVGLSSTATEIPALAMANDRSYPLIASLSPLQFLHPLVAYPYIPPRSIHTAHSTISGTAVGGQDGAIPHMAPRGPPPFLTSRGTTNATRSVRPRHSEPQTLTADDGTSSGKGDPKEGVHHHHTGTTTHATIPREEEGHHASIVL